MSYSARNSLILGVLALLVLGGGGYAVGVWQMQRIQALEATEADQIAELQQITAILAQYDAVRAELDGLKQRWRTRWQVVPASDSPATTLAYLNNIREGVGNGVNFGFQFKGRRDHDDHSTHGYALEGRARFANLYNFIRTIERGERFYTVDQLEIEYRDPEARKPGWTWVNFKMLFRAYFEPGSRIEDLDPPRKHAASSERPPNPFFPHITRTLPENAKDLFDVGDARLTALSSEIAYLVDARGRPVFLRKGDLVFMGHLDEIDLERNQVAFILNKGGVWERLILNVEISNELR